MLPLETEPISPGNTILMSIRGCHTLLHLTQLKIVILFKESDKTFEFVKHVWTETSVIFS